MDFSPPTDNGVFVHNSTLWALDDYTTECCGRGAVKCAELTALHPTLKYFVRVGGGYQAFTHKRNATRFAKQEDY